MTMSEKERQWQSHLDSGHIVIMDNDGWWFEDEYGEWVSGGNGPYGVDLLNYMLWKHGVEMEWV